MLLKTGLGNYYLRNYSEAAIYFKKAVHLKTVYADLWLAKALIKTNQTDSASAVLTNFCKDYSLNKDSLSVVIEEDMKNGH